MLYLLLDRNQYSEMPLDFQEESYQQWYIVNCLKVTHLKKGSWQFCAWSFLLQLLQNTIGWSVLLQVKAVELMGNYILIIKTEAKFYVREPLFHCCLTVKLTDAIQSS